MSCQLEDLTKSRRNRQTASGDGVIEKLLAPTGAFTVTVVNYIYGWNFSRWIFSPKVVTFFETLAAVFGHFLH